VCTIGVVDRTLCTGGTYYMYTIQQTSVYSARVCVRGALRWCAVAVVARQPARTSRNHGRLTGTRGRDVGRSGDRNRCVNVARRVSVRACVVASQRSATRNATDLTDAAAAASSAFCRRWTGGDGSTRWCTQCIHHDYTGAGVGVGCASVCNAQNGVGGRCIRAVTTVPAAAAAGRNSHIIIYR